MLPFFVPAEQTEIAILAMVAGAGLGIVVIHHLIRITLIIPGASLVAGRIRVSRPWD